MTTTPDLQRDDAARGVDALNATFIARAGAAVRPVVEDLVAKTDGSLGVTLETLTPGPALAAVLAGLDPSLLTPAEQVSFLIATERLTAWIASLQNAGLVAFTGTAPTATQYTVDGRAGVLVDARRTEIAGHLLWSEGMARSRVATARALAADLPQTHTALTTGAISMARATVIAEGAQNLTSGVDTLLEHAKDGVDRVELLALRRDMLTAYEVRVTGYAGSHDTGRTRAHVTRTIARLDPAGWAARRQRAIREHSNVTLRHHGDGLSELTAVMATEHAIACAQVIETRARQLQESDPTSRIGLHRATALQQLLTEGSGMVGTTAGARAVDAADAARRSGGHDNAMCAADAAAADGPTLPATPRLQLNITIDLATLLALREGVGEIAGAGPIPADVVRQLVSAGGASIRWLTTNQAGDPISASPSYRIPEALRALIISRDHTCAMPNCSTPAMACEIDHIQPWDTGGTTSASNLQALCTRHHQTKTHSTPVRGTGASQNHAGYHVTPPAPTSPANGHALEDLRPLHARLATLQQQLEELTDLGLTNTTLETAIAELDANAIHLFDDTLDQQLADALPHARNEGVVTTMLRHQLQRHHLRTCRTSGVTAGQTSIHAMRHCPNLIQPIDTPPF